MSETRYDLLPDEAYWPKCDNCGQRFRPGELTALGQEAYCPDCLSYIGFYRCEDCGEAVPKGEAVRTFNEGLKKIDSTHRVCPDGEEAVIE